ncbi:MAG: phosphotransferase, partial [bacterium]
WRIELAQRSDACIAEFISANPGYAVDPVQPQYRGGPNLVTFGSFHGQPVVFKHYVDSGRWANERFCLNHFARTGLVPRVLHAIEDTLIVMTRLPGEDIGVALADGKLGPERIGELSAGIGGAIGRLVQVPLPPIGPGYSPIRDFRVIVCTPDLSETVGRYLAAGRRARESAAVYRVPFFSESLALLEWELSRIPERRRVLFHEDIFNQRAEQGVFCGFYDFEMCRLGTEEMQLGVAVDLCGPGKLDWDRLIEAYEEETKQTLSAERHPAILAMNHFYHLIRICRWGGWDGGPDNVAGMSESVDEAATYLSRMRESCRTLAHRLDLAEWFPSLGA